MRDAQLDREYTEQDLLYCQHCDRRLRIGRVEWLELNSRTLELVEPGTADWSGADESQGMYPYGVTCAKKLLATTAK